MPSKTRKQQKAMFAAASGHSTLGIPQKVGQEFVAADKAKAKASDKPALLAKGGKLVDHGDHFKVHTAGGDTFHIAKKPLHPATVKHLMKFAEGGKVPHYEAGRGPADEENEADFQDNLPQEWDDEKDSNYDMQAQYDPSKPVRPESEQGEANEAAAGKLWTARVKDQNDAEEKRDQSMALAGLAGDPIGKATEEAAKPSDAKLFSDADTSAGGMPPGAKPQDQGTGGSGPAVPTLDKHVAPTVHGLTADEKKGMADQQAANLEYAKGEQQRADAAGKVYAQQVQDARDRQAKSDEFMSNMAKRQDQLRSDIENGKIDPGHLWHSAGTGAKIAAGIGLLLGGLGSGIGGGPNLAAKAIDDMIDRDIDAQKANLHTKQSLLADTYRQTNDFRLAQIEAKSNSLAIAQGQLNAIAAQSASAAVKQRALVANALIDQKRGQLNREAADRRSVYWAAAKNADINDANAYRREAMKLQAKGNLKTISARTNFAIGAIRQFGEVLDQARSKNPGWWHARFANITPGDRAQADWEDLTGALAMERGKISKQGSPSEQEIRELHKNIPGAGFFSTPSNRANYLKTQEDWARGQARGISEQMKQEGYIDPFGDPKMQAWMNGGPWPGGSHIVQPHPVDNTPLAEGK